MTPDLSVVFLGTGTTLALITAIGAQNAFVLRQGVLGQRMTPIILFCLAADILLYALGISGMGFLVEKSPWVITVLKWGGVIFLVSYGALAAKRAIRPSGEALVVTPQDAIGPHAQFPEDAGREGADDGAVLMTHVDDTATVDSRAPGLLAPGQVTTGTLPRVEQTSEKGVGVGAKTGKVKKATKKVRSKTSTPRTAPQLDAMGKVLLTCAAMTFLNPHTYLDTVVLIGSVANQQGEIGRWWFFIGACIGSLMWFLALGYGARLLRPLFARSVTWRVLDAGVALLMFTLAFHLITG